MRTSFLPGLALAAVLAGATLASACSSSSSGSAPCNVDPFSCAAGTVCWPKDTSANFTCITSGAGKSGDACQNAPGTATCSDGLACLQTQSAGGGSCTPYCDPNNSAHGCPSGQSCALAQIIGTTQTFHVCHGGTPPADGGTDSAPPPEDASGGADGAAD